MKFNGYLRTDGKVGIRNHVLILPVSICASDVARKVCKRVQGTVTFHNHLGCSQSPFDQECTIRTMAGLAANPNVFGTIMIALGCENCQLDIVKNAILDRTNKPLVCLSIQKSGGAKNTIEEAVQEAKKMVENAKLVPLTEHDFSKLIIGTECGGSDPTSGLVTNVVMGKTVDSIIEEGGTTILSETTEFIGAENILAQRALNQQVADDILRIISRYEESQKIVGNNIRQRNPSPGNKAGGITTLEEKSLGCVLKSGSKKIRKVVDYAELINENGLIIMDTPGNDSTSMMGMVAGGCQLILFSTGRGTPMGHPIVPVIKMCGNPSTCVTFEEHIDFDVSKILQKNENIDEAGKKLLLKMINVINGEKTKSESLGFYETSIVRVGKYLKNNEVYSYYY